MQVILVGGATRMPAVRNSVRYMTGLEPRPELVDPDAAVALGAAIYAGVLSGEVTDLLTLDNWKAALMRALVGHRFENDPSLKAKFIPDEGSTPAVSGELDTSWDVEDVDDELWDDFDASSCDELNSENDWERKGVEGAQQETSPVGHEPSPEELGTCLSADIKHESAGVADTPVSNAGEGSAVRLGN
jgi:molecular chaperone DnaK (HSP70)